jgi:hypothetical protein
MASSNEKIVVESNFSNIVIVNPNKVYNDKGFAEDRFVKQENLIMYANLQCNLQPRSRLIVGQDFQTLETIATTSINFLNPGNQGYLTTKWTEQPGLTGDDDRVINTELLGITNITQKMTAKNISTVDIQLEDVRGRALFESGNQSVYSAFFNLPYPTFYLTVKGYYGKALRYPLILQKFQASFDQSSGNFLVTLNFIGYKYNVLGDVTLGYLESVPNMYLKETTQNTQIETTNKTQASVGQINNTDVIQDTSTTYLGFEKLKEVYSIYKSKGLIEPDFPEMSIQELIVRLDYFERDLLVSYGSVNLDKLTDAQTFSNMLKDFSKDIITSTTNVKSWRNEYLGQQNFFVLRTGEKIFTYKPKFEKYDDAYSDLNNRIKNNIEKISNCPTFGSNSKGNSSDIIDISIKKQDIIIEPFPVNDDINFVETAKQRLGKLQLLPNEEEEFINEFNTILDTQKQVIQERENANPPLDASRLIQVPFFFKFDGDNYFNNKIYKYQKIIATREQDIQEQLTEDINQLIKSNKGIGFNPSIRNILAVIFASADAFLRLMDDVHRKAFDVRNSSLKKQAVKNDIQEPYNINPVYPWPQFSKEELSDDGQIRYDLKYPGAEFAQETGAYDYSIWPEVEFVEEFIRGFTMREQIPLRALPVTTDTIVNRSLIAGYDNLTNDAYSNSQDIAILYELWERIQNIANFTGFVREEKFEKILELLQGYESSNLIIGLGKDNPKLTEIYKEENFNNETYLKYIYDASNDGNGKYYTNLYYGNVNTQYLNNELKKPSTLIKTNLPQVNAEIKTLTDASEFEDKMKEYMADTDKNNVYFSDTYPFIIEEWNYNNLVNGTENHATNKVLNTSTTLFYSKTYKKITNFQGDTPDVEKIRPFYKFIDLSKETKFFEVSSDYKSFFSKRYDNIKQQSFTEGIVDDLSTNLDGTQTTFTKKTSSLLNSQLFNNAIQIGIAKEVSEESNRAYTEAAFLFLNSIPISSPSNKYLDTDGGVERNYIGPSLKKYGAIHSLPKMFVCKIGSIWHRYKTYIQDGVDILENCLIPFNENQSYDPVNSDTTKVYNFTINGQNTPIVLYNTQLVDNFTLDIVNVGFYPKLLKDFYFFLNNGILYENNDTIQSDIQKQIDSNDIKIISSGGTSIVQVQPTPENKLVNGIQLNTFSVLFKVLNNDSSTTETYYYGAPSFGSSYNQTRSECFPNGVLIKNIATNQAVYNGATRILWGVANYGYMPTIIQIPSYDEYFVKGEDFKITITDDGAIITGDKIDDILGTFTFDELEMFEQEFFDFSKPANRTTTDFNFQRIIRKGLQLNLKDFNNTDPIKLVETFQVKQESQFNSIVNKYMNQNFYFQKGNPSNLNRKNLSYFAINENLKIEGVEKEIQLYSLTPDSVPTGGTLTLIDSQTNYPEAWEALRLRVGFLNYTGFTYTDEGSHITDFFPKMNIAFTPEMIQKFSEEIKLYASRQWVNSGNTNFNFKKEVDDYLTQIDIFRNNIINGVFVKLKSGLPQSRTEKNIDNSATEGSFSKLEYYNLFKAINDKWVAGNNYNSETLFEDCLFLDRANRDVGNQVIVDIKKTRDYLKDNEKTPLYFIVTSIATDVKFQVFSLPSYVNFYNVQKVGDKPYEDDEETIASKMFGAYNTVDYQDSKTKLVFVYTEVESEQIQNNNPKNGYLDDSFNISSSSDNPILDTKDKTDIEKGQSNKVVGFAVDFGLQNQSVFTNIQVSQDLGKATSESLQQTYDLANVYRGTKSSTQSVSLYNIYKTRSYKATITGFGNVMIQPTMYFVLRNVPLFAGPYFVTDVEHIITNGNFTTKIVGTRQKLYTPPIENALLNTIKSTYLSKLTSQLRQKRESEVKLDTNTIQVKNTVANNMNAGFTEPGSSICEPAGVYKEFAKTTPKKIDIADKNLFDLINSKLSAETKYVYVVYTLFASVNFKNGYFSCLNNNLSNTPISEKSYGQSSFALFEKEFICLNGSDNQQQAFAVFNSPEKCIDFNYERYKNDFANIDITSETKFVNSFSKTWIEKVPYDNVGTSRAPKTKNLFENFITTNPGQYDLFKTKVKESYIRVKAYLT